ncbi:MAG: DNA-processing protein DprA [Gemmataceae bacterium]|nr:DNA-processing protein DprA [Gemmataceae bacterium]
MTADDDWRDHLALALVPGLGPRLTAALLERFGSAAAARRATAEQLRCIPHIGPKLARQLADALHQVDGQVQRECELMARHGVRAVIRGRAGYPTPLLNIPTPPPLLFVKGTWEQRDMRAVAIVGTRQATPAGLRLAAQLARGLVRAGYTVVSGLARGIDAAAHQGALEGGGRTIAVLASGLGRIYPPEHDELARHIAPEHGCLLSETPMQTPPQAGMFPARNRLISGLSQAVVLVEAGERSGALITAQHALEQGRELFAVPGSVDNPACAGCLALLRQGARLIRNVQDLLEDLQGLTGAPEFQATRSRTADLLTDLPVDQEPATGVTAHAASASSPGTPSQPPQKGSPTPITPTATAPHNSPPVDSPLHAIWSCLPEPRHVDELARLLGRSIAELLPQLLQMELQGYVRRLPGNFYERL